MKVQVVTKQHVAGLTPQHSLNVWEKTWTVRTLTVPALDVT